MLMARAVDWSSHKDVADQLTKSKLKLADVFKKLDVEAYRRGSEQSLSAQRIVKFAVYT